MDLIEARKLGKQFGSGRSRVFAVRGMSFSLPSRGLVAILGKSGSGKSTLLNLLSGLERPSKGEVFFRGTPLKAMKNKDLEDLRLREIGFVFQHYNLIDHRSVKDNILLPMQMRRHVEKRKLEELLSRFHLKGIESKEVDLCSGGERQRTAIARALSGDPSVLFADEPTGALDEENAKAVMDSLKEASKDRLVVMVTHNRGLIETCADGILLVEDGRARYEKEPPLSEGALKKHSRSRSSFWRSSFLRRNLKRNAWKNALCFFSGVVGFTFGLLGIGYQTGSEISLKEEARKTLLLQKASLTETTSISLPNSPLSLLQNQRPSLEDSKAILHGIDCNIVLDYSFFVPEASPYSFDGTVQSPVSFAPISSSSSALASTLLASGRFFKDGLSECVVNEELSSSLGDCLGKEISFSSSSTVLSEGGKELLSFFFSMKIVGVVREFSFLNSPRVYYSYEGLSSLMGETELPLLSSKEGKSVSVSSFLESVPSDSSYANYDRLVFLEDREGFDRLTERIESLSNEEGWSISSEAKTVADGYSSLLQAFGASLWLFLGISLIGVVLILGIAGYSSFVGRKKESAVLLSLGARRKDIRFIFVSEASAVSLASCVASLLLCPASEWLANRLFESQIQASSLIQIPLSSCLGVPLGLPLLFLAGSLFVAFVSTVLPISIANRFPIAQELKDE